MFSFPIQNPRCFLAPTNLPNGKLNGNCSGLLHSLALINCKGNERDPTPSSTACIHTAIHSSLRDGRKDKKKGSSDLLIIVFQCVSS
ncbi:hypothetical protein CDAR_392231 [Caerostris darwini]|uniref:Uncharacterized protein n=1 Tax=Caerostris darwini TaxID=1538125 RepID=A0AAV4SMN6_9ARAC|nr:hypothetical protein CDAR_392231 [Caerostris darwini]